MAWTGAGAGRLVDVRSSRCCAFCRPLAAAAGSRYTYAGGNPITGADPTGLISIGTIGLILGGVALVATGVGLLGGAALIAGAIGVSASTAAIGLSATAVATGTAAVVLDANPCLREHETTACMGMIMGGAGSVAGLGGLGVEVVGASMGGMTDGMEEFDTAMQLHGLLYGGIASTADLIGQSQSTRSEPEMTCP